MRRFRDLRQYNQSNRDRWVELQASLLPAGVRVLDVGAGAAPYRKLFAHCIYRTHDFGLEPSTVGRYTTLDYESDIVAIPVPDASFDVVLCTEVLEHVPNPPAAIAEMARIIVPGGTLLLTAPLGSVLHQEPFHFYGGFTPHWYRKFLTECGFTIEELTPNLGFFSLFGQEAQRFSALINPFRNHTRHSVRILLAALWLLTLPIFRWLLPSIGAPLDGLTMESVSTAGYHVRARRTSATT